MTISQHKPTKLPPSQTKTSLSRREIAGLCMLGLGWGDLCDSMLGLEWKKLDGSSMGPEGAESMSSHWTHWVFYISAWSSRASVPVLEHPNFLRPNPNQSIYFCHSMEQPISSVPA